MIALLGLAAVVILPIAIVASVLGLIAGLVGSVAERDLGVGLFADRDA
jgi:hypothetical protein